MQQMSGEQVKKQQFLLSLCGEMMYLINKLISYLHLMGNNSLHKLQQLGCFLRAVSDHVSTLRRRCILKWVLHPWFPGRLDYETRCSSPQCIFLSYREICKSHFEQEGLQLSLDIFSESSPCWVFKTREFVTALQSREKHGNEGEVPSLSDRGSFHIFKN